MRKCPLLGYDRLQKVENYVVQMDKEIVVANRT
jgi:hypothetical protein